MNALKPFIPTFSLLLLASVVRGGEEVDRLLKEYGRIETVSCQIRRTKEGAAGKMRFLSRVYWTNKDQLHAEGIAPLKRRTIADGTRLYQYVEGDPKGFSRPVAGLSEQMTISLKLVPGTAMEHLLRLKGLPEELLPATDVFQKRVGIQTENNYVVLSFDAQDRLALIEFFKTKPMDSPTASYVYSDFSEVLPGVWLPMTHETAFNQEDVHFRETVKVDRLIANKPIAPSLFVPANFFDKNIDFVDDFAKIYAE